MKSITEFFKKHQVLLLIIAIVITSVIIYNKYIFSGYIFMFDDIGSDTKQQYIMQFHSIVNHIRNGNFSLWDMTNGFGTSLYQLNLFNPLLWIIYLFGIILGPSAMAGSLIYVYILALVCSGIAMWYFLNCFELSGKAKLLAAYIYAFNGFMTIWGQHYAFTAIMIYLPLLLMVLEKAIRKARFSPLVSVCTGLMVLCTYYFSYMSLIIAGLYVIIRLWTLRTESIRKYFSILLKQLFAVLIGVGIGLVNLIPSYSLISNITSRLSSGSYTGMLFKWPGSYYKTLILRFLSGGIQGNSSASEYAGYGNLYEAPNVFFTSLFVVLLIQFIIYLAVSKKQDMRIKTASFIAIIFGALMLCVPAASMVFNFFSYPFSRHTFLLMPFFALLAAYMMTKLIRERFFNIAGAIIAAICCIAVYYLAYTKAAQRSLKFFILGLTVCTIVMVICLILYSKSSKKHLPILYVLICITVAGQIIIDGYSCIYKRESVTSTDSYFEDLYGTDYTELTSYLKENDRDLYRLEKDYTIGSHCMDSLAQDYNGISTYNSTMNANILEFVSELVPEINYANSSHISFVQIADKKEFHDLFGVKYLISKSSDVNYEGYVLEKQFGELYLYRNTNWSGFASFYTNTVSSDDYNAFKNSGISYSASDLLADALILDNTATTVDLNSYVKQSDTDFSINDADLPSNFMSNGDGSYVWITDSCTEIPLTNTVTDENTTISVSIQLDSTIPIDVNIGTDPDGASYIAQLQAAGPKTVNINLPIGTDKLYFSYGTDGVPVSIYSITFSSSANCDHTQNASISIADSGNDGLITANVSNPEDGYMFIPIPYEDGWSFTVDGEKTEALRADYGFAALKLSAGEHTVVCSYDQPLFTKSLIGTLVFVILLAAIIVIRTKKSNKKR